MMRSTFVFLLLFLSVAACDCEEEAGCRRPGVPEACGVGCYADDDCPAGLYCTGLGICGADCTAEDVSECASGECGSDGRCLGEGIDGGGASAGEDGSVGDARPSDL